MQTEATPREPFTLGVLFRYKLTIVMIAILVIAGGYVRIVTQPPLYEATARLAVRFSGEAVPLREMRGDSMFRLPLLEEEVKAYMVQIKDPQFLHQVLQDFPLVEEAVPSTSDDAPSKSPTALQRFKEQFLRTYYDIRRAVLSVIDAVLLTDDALLSEKEQQIMQIISRLEVTAGTEASHIIGVTYRNKSDTLAAKMVNSIASSFIKKQKKRVQPMDEKKYEKAAEDANLELVRMKTRLYELTDTLESPTLEEAIRKKYARLDTLLLEESQLQLALRLLEQSIVPFYRDLPLETPVISGDLGRELLNILVRYDEQQKRVTERPEFYTSLIASARKILDELKQASIQRDRVIVVAVLTDPLFNMGHEDIVLDAQQPQNLASSRRSGCQTHPPAAEKAPYMLLEFRVVAYGKYAHDLLSSIIVTGPQLSSETRIRAPKTPVCTVSSDALQSATNLSNSGSACSGGIASVKLGLRPRLQSAISVNCDTARISYPRSRHDRFIFPPSSSKILRLTHLSARNRTSSSVSPIPAPTRRRIPLPIEPTDSPSTSTEALRTRCRTTFIATHIRWKRGLCQQLRLKTRKSGI